MSNIGNFKRVGREVVYKGKILEFCQDEIQTSKGHHVTWDFLNHKGAAAIVPVMDDGKILMVKQWRNVVNRVSLEIPAGACKKAWMYRRNQYYCISQSARI